jgi:hypothetical protein
MGAFSSGKDYGMQGSHQLAVRLPLCVRTVRIPTLAKTAQGWGTLSGYGANESKSPDNHAGK